MSADDDRFGSGSVWENTLKFTKPDQQDGIAFASGGGGGAHYRYAGRTKKNVAASDLDDVSKAILLMRTCNMSWPRTSKSVRVSAHSDSTFSFPQEGVVVTRDQYQSSFPSFKGEFEFQGLVVCCEEKEPLLRRVLTRFGL